MRLLTRQHETASCPPKTASGSSSGRFTGGGSARSLGDVLSDEEAAQCLRVPHATNHQSVPHATNHPSPQTNLESAQQVQVGVGGVGGSRAAKVGRNMVTNGDPVTVTGNGATVTESPLPGRATLNGDRRGSCYRSREQSSVTVPPKKLRPALLAAAAEGRCKGVSRSWEAEPLNGLRGAGHRPDFVLSFRLENPRSFCKYP